MENHPSGWLWREALSGTDWARAEAKPCDAGMVLEIEPGFLQPYLDAVAAGRPPGWSVWPLAFLIC